MKSRRVGTITCGTVLVVLGILCLLHFFIPTITYTIVLKFWPLILVALGVEILISAIRDNEEEKMRYDAAAIVITGFMSVFAMGMGALEQVVQHIPNFVL